MGSNLNPHEDEESNEIADVSLENHRKVADSRIEKKYDETSARILQERLDFLLPNIADHVKDKRWLNIRPKYQRRLRWDVKKKSLLIESLLMNIPIPPIFLYEQELNRYEVMDGQQRLSAILDFYSNDLELTGLEHWPELNGRTYEKCPTKIQRGLDRRRLSAVVLLAESDRSLNKSPNDIRLQVFKRLNTGGTALNAQELRNSVFRGKLNDLVVELAKLPTLNRMLGMPIVAENISDDGKVSEELEDNQLYKTMGDCQIVLRFFAFRHEKNIVGSVRSILDNYMAQNLKVSSSEIISLKEIFESRLQLARRILGTRAFYLPGERGKLSRPLFDAVMVAIDQLFNSRDKLIENRVAIRSDFAGFALIEKNHKLIVGNPNTADAIKQRIKIVKRFFKQYLK